MIKPSVLMLDEPTAGVSPIVMDELFDHIQRIKEKNVAILMVEQNARQALNISDRGYVLVMGENKAANEVRYIHGEFGQGFWTFYGGHDPEDYQHRIGDPETVLDLHKNSPGYRLILNNVLFPAAEKKKLKT